MAPKTVEKFTTIVRKYPSFRNDQINGCWKYMEGRRKDDGAESYWRVGDRLYDLKRFIDKHPGGQTWLTLSEVCNFCRC